MKVLVTGGAGFIGSAVCRYLVRQKNIEVLNVDKLTYAANPASLEDIADHDHYRFLKADIRDREALDEAFEAFAPDAVLHLAAESHVDRSITGAAAFIETNVLGSHVLLEAARAYWSGLPRGRRERFRFLHVSTDEVFGSLGEEGRFDETTPYDPSSPYSASKAASDHLVMAWRRTYGFPVLLANSSNNYGPRQFPEKLIPLTILNAAEGKPLPVYGDGSNIRDWLYVEDHARALYLILTQGREGEQYTVGGESEVSNRAVVEGICDLMDVCRPGGAPHRRLIEFVADRPGHDYRYAVDTGKIRAELGWRPQESFATGLEKTVQWYLEHRQWWQPLRDGVYAGERLGLLHDHAAAV